MFFSRFQKKRQFLRFFEMTCQKVISWKQISSGNIEQCQILTAVKMNINNNDNDRLTAFDPGQPG